MPLSIEVSGWGAANTGPPSGPANVSGVTVSGLIITESNDVIYAWIASSTSGVWTISGGGLTWNSRFPIFGDNFQYGRAFYATATSPISGFNVTAGFGDLARGALAVVSVAGANTAAPFDSNLTIPLRVSGLMLANSDTVQSGIVSTNNANDMLLGFVGINLSGPSTGTVGSGWTQLSRLVHQQVTIATGYLLVSATQTNLAISFVSGGSIFDTQYALAGDAIVQATITAAFKESGSKRQYRREGFRR